jgi:ubiquinone/menaquinone biosynthesis C-methylase UbiE
MGRVTRIVWDFDDVDAAATPQAHLDYLEKAEAFPPMAAVREHTYAALPPGRGVDVGCGRGRAVADLTAMGRPAVGVDRSDTMVRSARKRFPACEFTTGDAAALPFEDGSLDWYRAERTYLHIADQLRALAEARRVLRPGGTAVVADQDFDSTVMASPDPALTRTVVTALTDSMADGRAGTRMPALLAEAGFTDVTVHALPLAFSSLPQVEPLLIEPAEAVAVAAGVVSEAEARAWRSGLERLDREGTFVVAMTMFVTTGRRP